MVVVAEGTVLKSEKGRLLKILGLIGFGGEAVVRLAEDQRTGERGAAKIFNDSHANRETEKRTEYLVNKRLAAICPVLSAPVDWIRAKNVLGHYTPLAPGVSLEKYLETPDGTLMERIVLALAIAHAVAILHKAEISHGDLHTGNLIVLRQSNVLVVHIIDLDNFRAPGSPPPCMLGHPLYMAPEIREAIKRGKTIVPDICADRFSLAMVLHEVLLWRHVASGFDSNESDFDRAMSSGRWLHDPLRREKIPKGLGGYSAEILNGALMDLFRSALSLDPRGRASAEDWESALQGILDRDEVFLCPRCGDCCVFESTRVACATCGRPYPPFRLVTAKGRRIALEKRVVPVGRADLGGAMTVSGCHAILRRIGPETWIESLGSNGTYRWNGRDWFRLPEGKPILLSANDRLSFADQVVNVEEVL